MILIKESLVIRLKFAFIDLSFYNLMYIDYKKTTLAIIFSIIIIGLIAIPIGNPKFIYRAIGLELSFVILSILLWKGYTQALYACIPISVLVIIGNTLAPPHVNLMLTFSKPLNAIVLIVGGYILQTLLIFFSIKYLSEIRSKKLSKKL
ncbi:MAG TPA: hypothetical protein VK250_04865 [Nitrososphaeraceae archaeon]|nr:hypothetical protein [Nitrososphaeraceae archaeon]